MSVTYDECVLHSIRINGPNLGKGKTLILIMMISSMINAIPRRRRIASDDFVLINWAVLISTRLAL